MKKAFFKRLRNKYFIMAIFSTVAYFGKESGLYVIPEQTTMLFNCVVAALVTLGIVIDPTTPGLKDGE